MATTQKNPQDFQKTITDNAKSLAGIYSGYDDIYTKYANGLVNDGSFQAIENARANALDSANSQYNDAAKNYYTQYKQNQMALPERLSNLGVTGGATESALLRLMNQYSGNVYQNQQARAKSLNDINMQYNQQIADNSKSIANQLAEIYLQLALQARADKKEADEAAKAAASYSSGGSGGSYYYGGDSSNDYSGVKPSGTAPKSTIPNGGITPAYLANVIANNKADGRLVVQPSSNAKKGGSGSTTAYNSNRKYNVKGYK